MSIGGECQYHFHMNHRFVAAEWSLNGYDFEQKL